MAKKLLRSGRTRKNFMKDEKMRRRILIVEVNWIGDVLFSTPFIRAVRKAYPESHIACLLHPRCREMLESNPRVDEIIIYDEEGKHRGLFGKAGLIAQLRKKGFDTAFILHRSFTKALIAVLAGIGERIGYGTKNRSFLLTKALDEPFGLHKVEYFLNVAKKAGIGPDGTFYEFFAEDRDKAFIDNFLKDYGIDRGKSFAVICPGGNWDPKRWPRENFARLADLFTEKLGLKVVISGAKKDMPLVEEIRKMMKNDAIISCGRTTLKQLGALLGRADLVVANDTGPMHLGVAMKTKVIALFGPTSPTLTGPYGDGNYTVISKNESCEVPCYDMTCADNSCMAAIKVEDVFEAAEKILGKNEDR